MLEGRSKKAFKDWLAERDQAWRDKIEVVAITSYTVVDMVPILPYWRSASADART